MNKTIQWLDASQEGSKEEKQKELESIAIPIMQGLYSSAGGVPGGAGSFPGAGGFLVAQVELQAGSRCSWGGWSQRRGSRLLSISLLTPLCLMSPYLARTRTSP